MGTIKYYMREGLLPPPTLKTGRTMAYYDRCFVDRIRAIKELQQKRFLPLDVIKAILEGNQSVISRREVDMLLGLEGRFYEEVHYARGAGRIARTEAAKRYRLPEDAINYCVRNEILTPTERDGEEMFEGDDVALLENIAEMYHAGFDDDLLPMELSVPIYVTALGDLARQELKLFSRAVTGKVDEAKVPGLAMAGVKLAEQFIVLLRRKLLLRAIQELREETWAERMEQETDSEEVAGVYRNRRKKPGETPDFLREAT